MALISSNRGKINHYGKRKIVFEAAVFERLGKPTRNPISPKKSCVAFAALAVVRKIRKEV